QERVKFWGTIITASGIQMDPKKEKAIQGCDRPENQAALKSFLGMVNYCARFIKGHVDLTAPLRDLAKKSNAEFDWSPECERSFKALKSQLCGDRTLTYFDVKKRTELIMDASPIGLGAI
ncbi:RNase H-like domain-containing protein, partial [Salmonella enterica]|uniref:RNase H-like domain-containing protein n=1 Tax=Salmonella enterica TaxID=28901 RepID=UPI0035257BC8